MQIGTIIGLVIIILAVFFVFMSDDDGPGWS